MKLMTDSSLLFTICRKSVLIWFANFTYFLVNLCHNHLVIISKILMGTSFLQNHNAALCVKTNIMTALGNPIGDNPMCTIFAVCGKEQLGKTTFLRHLFDVLLPVGDSKNPQRTTNGLRAVIRQRQDSLLLGIDSQGTATPDLRRICQELGLDFSLASIDKARLANQELETKIGSLLISLQIPVVFFLENPPHTEDITQFRNFYQHASSLQDRNAALRPPSVVVVFRNNNSDLVPLNAWRSFREKVEFELADDVKTKALLPEAPPTFNLFENPNSHIIEYRAKIMSIHEEVTRLAAQVRIQNLPCC